MLIRKFRKHDAERLASLIVQNLKTVTIKDYPKNAVDTLIKHNTPQLLIEKSKNGIVIVAEMDKKIVGTACLFDDRVGNVLVDKNMHGKGIGKSLMDRIEKIALDNNNEKIFTLASISAENFYKKMGYKKKEIVEPNIDGTKVKMIRMEKNLKSK